MEKINTSADNKKSKSWLWQILGPVLIGIVYFCYNKNLEYKRLKNVLNALLLQEKSVNISTELPVAIGFGSCLDLLVDGVSLMNAITQKPPKEKKYHEKIKNLDELSEMFALFFSQGAAVERFIPKDLLNKMVAKAELLQSARWAGGGNAPVISHRFYREGFQNILVGARASHKLRSFYSPSIQFSEHIDEPEDIHLILEYKVGDKWGDFVAPRANRFIVHSDQINPLILSLEAFSNKLNQINPRLIIVSALQMLDNFPFEKGVREERMLKLAQMLNSTSKSSLIHFEMASFSEAEMIRSLLLNVLPYVDSLGMNEQELPNLASMVNKGTVVTVSDANPKTAIILDDLRELYQYSKTVSHRGLSRIHVHTLSFQAILIKKGSQWKNNKAGSAKASLVAHRHVCGVDEINLSNAKIIMDDSFSLSLKTPSERVYFNETSPISCWNEDDYELCLAPVLVCTDVKQTVGGGDNITPAGLIPQM
ncbi:ADP-dependent glucokinase [Hydra vulgaris]|uniref:ADP-dependent glucokinase n=1 Tax=Hydra vulgaris TaxID=6087 RepID=A0ABM4CG61_HYDVU